MASLTIHLVIASKINEVLKRDNDKLLLGTIIPDIWKTVGIEKKRTHFFDIDKYNIPNVDKFLNKYKKYLYDDFVMGYYIHLYVDYLWFKYFIPEIYNVNNQKIIKLDGQTIHCKGNMSEIYIYNDYNYLNNETIKYYKVNLDIFRKKIPKINRIIEEVPINGIDRYLSYSLDIIENKKGITPMIFNFDNIRQFIDISIELILSSIEKTSLK